MIEESISLVRRQLQCVIDTKRIDAIAVTPHSIKRSVQLLPSLMKQIESHEKHRITLSKYTPSRIAVPQKSLKKREERIQNARETILVEDRDLSSYSHVLLIDDFV